ncbi:MAG: PadR family transcriptional regulator [Clostridiaceae bacterium]
MPQNFLSDEDIRLEEKRLYEEYKQKLEELKKVKKERESMGQVFTKGLLPIYVLYILSLGPTNGHEISNKIGNRTNGMWIPSTGGIYPLLKKFEKQKWITGHWDDPEKKFQKIYTLTAEGYRELNNKKELLQLKIEEALEVFKIIYSDLYEDI